jgi:hypothetical protein
MSKDFDKDEAARKVLQAMFDDDAVYNETFNRMKASPTLKNRLHQYNQSCVAYDQHKMSAEEHNEIENAYYTEVLAPVSQQVATEILQRAIDLVRYQPYGPREDMTA